MAERHIDLRDISFKSFPTDTPSFDLIGQDLLDEAYEVGIRAYTDEMPSSRSESDIDHLMGGIGNFRDKLRHPASDILKGHIAPNQDFSAPVLTIGFEDFGKPTQAVRVFASSANNTSGNSERVRDLKRYSAIFNSRVLRSVVVDPDFQHRGLGTVASVLAFTKANFLQPGSGYTWPQEGIAGTRLLQSLGLSEIPADAARKHIYGTAEQVLQTRYETLRARGVLQHVLRGCNPETAAAINELVKKDSMRRIKRRIITPSLR